MADEAERMAWVRGRIDRFGLTTVEDARRSPLFDIGVNGVQKWLARRVEDQTLAAFPLVGRQLYYVHGREAVREQRLPLRRAEALGPLSLATAFGTLEFAVKRGVTKITPAEFQAQFSDLHAFGLPPSAYFLETAAAPRLGMVLIDHGADARRLVKKVKRAILRRAGLPAFSDLMDAGQFVIAVVTATEGKAKQIRRVNKKRPPRTVEVVVEVVPELVPLLVSGG